MFSHLLTLLSLNWHLIFKQIFQTFDGSSFLNVRICCLSLLFMTVIEESWGFDCWLDVTLDSDAHFPNFWSFYSLNK